MAPTGAAPIDSDYYALPPAERHSWLWETMDPHADLLVTDQGVELVAAYRRLGGRCGLCGEPVDLAIKRGPTQATLDHIVPQSLGGGCERSNLQLAHRGCNSRKGNR